MTKFLESAKIKLSGINGLMPFPVEALPKTVNDLDWIIIREYYHLNLQEMIALENKYCTK